MRNCAQEEATPLRTIKPAGQRRPEDICHCVVGNSKPIALATLLLRSSTHQRVSRHRRAIAACLSVEAQPKCPIHECTSLQHLFPQERETRYTNAFPVLIYPAPGGSLRPLSFCMHANLTAPFHAHGFERTQTKLTGLIPKDACAFTSVRLQASWRLAACAYLAVSPPQAPGLLGSPACLQNRQLMHVLGDFLPLCDCFQRLYGVIQTHPGIRITSCMEKAHSLPPPRVSPTKSRRQ